MTALLLVVGGVLLMVLAALVVTGVLWALLAFIDDRFRVYHLIGLLPVIVMLVLGPYHLGYALASSL